MSIGITTNIANLEALESRQAVVANNLANTSVPGFQKALFSISAARIPDRGSDIVQGFLPTGAIERSLQQGAIKVTGNPGDFAIHGNGFFQLKGPANQNLYTRNGEFHLNEANQLVNSDNLPVQGEGGPITVDPNLGELAVAVDGTVSQDGQQIAKLAIYEFENIDALKTYKGTTFQDTDEESRPRIIETPTVYQGQIEASNVSPMKEMISMIEITRAYELAQKMLQQSDELTEKTIQAVNS